MSRKLLLFGLVALLAACADEPMAVSEGSDAAPQASEHGALIGGHVYGPHGQNICSFYPDSAQMAVYTYGRDSTELFSYTGGAYVDCATSTYSITPVQKNEYMLMYRALSADLGTVKIPDVWITEAPMPIHGYAAHDIRIPAGEEPYGRALMDGAPIAGVRASINIWNGPYPPGFYGIGIVSGADGRWYDEHGQLVTLSPDYGYTISCPNLIASTMLEESPSSTYQVFPSDNNVLKCSYSSQSRAVNWSHTSNDLTTTLYPGYFGESVRPDWTGNDPGAGWGVQFHPGGGPTRDVMASEMFHGGLLISNGSQIIGASPMGSFGFECDDYCDNEFVSTDVGVTTDGSGRKVVEWFYNDNGQTAGVDLKVQQTSWTGLNGDYTIIRYLVRNNSASTTTLNVGWFMDWDVGSNPGQNYGQVDRDGRLMFVYPTDDMAPVVGTLILRKDAAGHFFRRNTGGTRMTLAEQIDAMAGTITNAAPDTDGDIWYMHSAESATLAPGAATVVWMALVAGESYAALDANATAAEAEVEAIRAGF